MKKSNTPEKLTRTMNPAMRSKLVNSDFTCEPT